MVSYSFDEATLSAAAGVNPWQKQRQLATGDPAAIEALASAFYKHSSKTSDAASAIKLSQNYVKDGFKTQGSSPLDVNAEAARMLKDTGDSATQTHQIAKILQGVGTDLDTAAVKARSEVSTLNERIGTLVQQFQQTVALYHHTGADREPDNGEDTALQGIFNEAVSATRTHGATVGHLLTGYETSLHSALRSMADLGYVPAIGGDEGPGGIDLTAGTKDGKTTVSAAKSGNKAQLQQSTYALSIINDAIKHDKNGHVDDDMYSYLYSYYDQTAGHSDTILKAVKDNHLQSSTGRTYADALLNLTRGAEQTDDSGHGPNYRNDHGPGIYGRGGVDGLPSAVQQVLSSDLGTVADGGDGTDMRRAVYVDGHWVIKNLSNDSGFSTLLTYASKDAQGGTGFSQHLGEAGLRWKQELNAVDHNTAAWVKADHDNPRDLGAPDVDPKKLNLPDGFTGKTGPGGEPVNNDQFASDALATASRNSDASTTLLLDTHDRRTLLGLNWNHGDGASDVITSGTAPDPTGSTQRNEATLAVMKDVGHDYKNFDAMANGQVKSALTLMGTRHIDTFAHDDPSHTAASGVGTILGPGGKEYQGVILSGKDQSDFLKMVAESGPSNYGLFHAAALEEGSRFIAHAGDSPSAHEAVRQASLLNGRVSNAGAAAVVDSTQSAGTHHKALYAAQLIQEQKQATQDWGQKLVGDGLDVVLGGAALNPELAPAIGVVAFLKGTMDTVTADVGGPGDPHNPDTQAIQALQKDLAGVANDPHELAKAALNTISGQQWMAVRAQAIQHPADQSIPYPERQPASSLVDVNGQPLPDFGESNDPQAPGKLENLMLATYGADKGNADATTGALEVLATDNGQDESWNGGKPDSGDRSLDNDNGSWGNGTSAYQIRYGDNSTYDWVDGPARTPREPHWATYHFQPAGSSPK